MGYHVPISLGNGQRGCVSIVDNRLKIWLDDELEGEPGVSVVLDPDKARDFADVVERTVGILEDG